jgi:S-(hydroxymethyl)glutathione dehydrogenase/alcohol dehydrogenase
VKTKAAILYEYKQPLQVEELDLDKPREKEVLVEMKSAGLCHSDLSIMKGVLRMPPLPCIPGHEGAGIVREVGPGVTRVKPGDHVMMVWVPSCGQCYYCRKRQPYLCAEKDKTRVGTMLDGTYRLKKGTQNINMMMGVGTFSQFNTVSERSVLPISPQIPFELAAVVGCSVMTGAGAVLNKAKVETGSSVAVVGAGGVGVSVLMGSVMANATQIIAIDILDNKLEMAKQFGATHTINAQKEDPVKRVMEITGGIGVDYSFEVLGSLDTSLTTYRLIRRGGSAVILGVPDLEAKLSLPLFEIPLMEKSVLGSYYGSGNLLVDLPMFLDLYQIGRLPLGKMITQRYRFQDINQGFADMEAGKNIRGVVNF